MEQLTLFEEIENDFPCADCVFDQNGRCTHIEGADFYCVRGSFRISRREAICPSCGKRMRIQQTDFGRDGGRCRCGVCKIFNNQGNRKSTLELFKMGQLIGT